MEHSPERELKLRVGPEFRLPSAFGLGGGAVRRFPPERTQTTYYDTDDLRLARWGASLRYRGGEGWTVKLPAERDAPFLVRPEVTFEGNGAQPPAEAVELVRAFVRDRELSVSARLATTRRRTDIHDAAGRCVGGVVDDAVSILNGDAATAFREVEVEIGDAMTPALLDSLVERLRLAGAGMPSPTSKYVRALAGGASLGPEVHVPDLSGEATAGDVVTRAVALSVIRLVLHDPVIRLDADPEGVHQARVATRRLRSDLRTFRSLVERDFSSRLRAELGWLAGALGSARDGDVLLERLRARMAELPAEEQAGAAGVIASLEGTRDDAHRRLLETLGSGRYVELLSTLVDAANAPTLTSRASAPAVEIVPALVRKPWHRLEKHVSALGATPSDDELHEARIRTKRVRYAAEATVPILGKPARTFARAAAALQETLGDLNDAVIAAGWLEAWTSAERDPAAERAATDLATSEHTAAASARATWRDAWERLAAPELRSWM